MDGSRVDALSRSLATSHSRRGLAGLLAGLALTGPLALLRRTEAEAKRKKGKRKKRRAGTAPAPAPGCTPQCSDKTCGDNGCGGTCGTCDAQQICQGGTCCLPNCSGKACGDNGCGGSCGTCGAGRTCCVGTCVDLATDTNHCGTCGRVCATGCEHGGCECTSGAGQCPGTGCTCAARFEGLPPVCVARISTTLCDADTDCPVGTNCLVNGKCSGGCP